MVKIVHLKTFCLIGKKINKTDLKKEGTYYLAWIHIITVPNITTGTRLKTTKQIR